MFTKCFTYSIKHDKILHLSHKLGIIFKMDLELIVQTVVDHLKTESGTIKDALNEIEDDGDYESLFNDIVGNVERVLEEKTDMDEDE